VVHPLPIQLSGLYPHLVINRSSGIWKGFVVELKSDTGRVSTEQREWLEMFLDEGYLVVVIRSLDAFIEAARLYLQGKSLGSVREPRRF